MEKFRNVALLLIGKRSESRHTLRGPTVADGRLDKFPLVVIQHNRGA